MCGIFSMFDDLIFYSYWMALLTKLKLFIEDLKISYTYPHVGFTDSQNRLRQSFISTKPIAEIWRQIEKFFFFLFCRLLLSSMNNQTNNLVYLVHWIFIIYLLKCDALKSDSLNQLRLIEFSFTHRINKFYCMMIESDIYEKLILIPICNGYFLRL